MVEKLAVHEKAEMKICFGCQITNKNFSVQKSDLIVHAFFVMAQVKNIFLNLNANHEKFHL